MKIAKAIRDLHAVMLPTYERLADNVGATLRPRATKSQWFYFARLKTLESFALKIETGRVADPAALEDFFACTLVVPTMNDINGTVADITSVYPLDTRRPPDETRTSKRPSSFEFDDLRLYVREPLSSTGRNGDIAGLLFEVQIKTVLQHAWSQATHDLTYKSASVNWSLERVAYQIKAMLEHAEVAIAEAQQLSGSSALDKSDERTVELCSLIDCIQDVWTHQPLPSDVKRLAQNILPLLRLCGFRATDFPRILQEEKERVGFLPLDLSPYAFAVQALAWRSDVPFRERLDRHRGNVKIVVHGNMELPDWLLDDHPRVIDLASYSPQP